MRGKFSVLSELGTQKALADDGEEMQLVSSSLKPERKAFFGITRKLTYEQMYATLIRPHVSGSSTYTWEEPVLLSGWGVSVS